MLSRNNPASFKYQIGMNRACLLETIGVLYVHQRTNLPGSCAMKCIDQWLAVVILAAVANLGHAGIIASSTFDSGLDGWTAIACDGTNCPAVLNYS